MINQLLNGIRSMCGTPSLRWGMVVTSFAALNIFGAPPVFVPAPILNQTILEDTTNTVYFSVTSTNLPLLYTFQSTSPSWLPIAALDVTGVPPAQTFRATPLADANGTSVVSIIVVDSILQKATNTFSIVVTPVNDAPYFTTSISNQSTDEDVNLTGLVLQIRDIDNPPGDLSISKSSSNPSLLLDSGIVVNGAGVSTNLTVNINLQPDKNGTSVVTLVVSDLDGAGDTNIFTVVVNAVPDTSTVSGVVNAAFGDDVGGTNIFTTVVIGDVDYGNPALANLNLSVSLGSDRFATFLGGTTNFTATASPDGVTAAITNLLVIPKRFTGFPETLHTETATIRVIGSDDSLVFTTNLFLDITVINSLPNYQIDLTPNQMIEGQSIQPFDLIYVSDPDAGDNAFTLAVDFANPAQSVFGSFVPTNVAVGNQTTLKQAIKNVRFQAASGVVTGVSEVVDLKFTLVDGYGGSNVVTNAMTIIKTQTPPSISGIPVVTFNKSDGAPPFSPLPSVFVSDPDEGGNQFVSATLALSDPTLGTLSLTNFSLQSSAQLTAALRAVQYTPTPGVLATNQSANTSLTLTVTDALNLEASNNNVTIRITSVNNAPNILNVPPAIDQPTLILPAPPLLPFKDLGLTNDDIGDVRFAITLDNAAKGVITNLGGFGSVGGGVYEITGSVSNILNSLTNLHYALSSSYLFPVDDPGGTVFTLSARDFALLTTTKTLAIQVQNEPRNFLVTRSLNDGLPGSFAYALDNVGNNDVITFALPSYPARVAMVPGETTRLILKNLTIKGPGANLLTLSGDTDGNQIPDRQLFSIKANVTMEGLTLSRGTAAFGGAIQVLSNGVLTLRRCAVVDSVADQYGGGIDVDGGQLTLDGCFIGRNRLSEETGMSGAGVSVYSDEDVRIVNTTFSDNVQPNETGDGGGALVVQNETTGVPLIARLIHSTFAENRDEAGQASAVFSVGFGTRVRPEHSIFGDFSGRNLQVTGTGEFQSQGRNICDDSTRTILTKQGQSEEVFLLDDATDATLANPLLAPLNAAGDPTPFYKPLPGSPAVDKAASSEMVQDQRGVVRVNTPDAGSIESDALGRLVINEIAFSNAPIEFIELAVRRDSSPVDLSGYSVFIDGVKIHDFLNGTIIGTNAIFSLGDSVPTLIDPGFGMVLALATNAISLTSSNNVTPVVGPSVAGSINSLKTRGRVTVAKNVTYPLAQQTWQGGYMDPVTGTNEIALAGNSVSLAPQFLGFSLIPHRFILGGPFDGADTTVAPPANPSSPGGDALGTPFGQDNAKPLALVDLFNLTEDELTSLTVVDNDFDGDGNDALFIVDISAASDPDTGDVGVSNSVLGASLAVIPTNSPLRGTTVLYDPRAATNLQALAEGVEISDLFYYEILDFGSAPVDTYTSGGAGTVTVFSVNHRLTTNDTVAIAGADIGSYNSVFPVVGVDSNSFTIHTNFVGAGTVRGAWTAQETRVPTSRSEASVVVRVVGVNDPPVAVADVITNVNEHSVVRIMTRPELAGTVVSFDTDVAPPPTMLPDDLSGNDTDIDTDDDADSLRVVGILPGVNLISGYAGTVGASPVSVTSTGHGLTNGDEVLISGYGGHNSYNGYQTVTVIDADTFTIPEVFVDDAPDKGLWVILNDSNRFAATTDVGATVTLLLRADPTEDHIVYDANPSMFLNGLQEDELYTNIFYYAVEDSHGGIGIGEVRMVVTGLNDTPTPVADPPGLGVLGPLVTSSNTLAQVLDGGLDLQYTQPPASGTSNRVDLMVLDSGTTLVGITVLIDNWFTDEQTPITINTADLLSNDGDVDRLDILSVDSVDALSRELASVTLVNPAEILYDPSVSTNLNALAREELVIDTFEIVVTDMMTAGSVTTLVAVVVVGLNDTPIAVLDNTDTTEDDVLILNPIAYPSTNPALHDIEFDIDGQVPDNRLAMLVVSNLITIGDAEVDITYFQADYDPTVSEMLNQLAYWQSYTDRFAYTISDHSFLFANDDEFRVPANSSNRVLNVLANDSDHTGITGTPVIINVGPTLNGGVAVLASNGTHVVYTSPALYTGDDLFRYTIQNSFGDTDTAVALVRSETPRVNGDLKAADDFFNLAAGESIILDVLVNDDVQPNTGAGLTITEVLNSSEAGQPILTNNTLVYTATNGLAPLTFNYRISGGGSAIAEASATVTITERRGTLDVQNDVFSVLPGSLDNELNVLANDALLTASVAALRIQDIITPASNGTVAANGTATALVYTPNPNFIGTERIEYLATDTIGGTGTGVLEIVVGVLTINPDFYTIPASTSAVPVVLDVLANDRLLPNPQGTLTITGISPAGGGMSTLGALQVNTNNFTEILFTPGTNAAQQDFDYTVSDASSPARTSTGRLTLAVSGPSVNANPDYYVVRGGSSGNQFGVLTNDISIPTIGKTYSVLSIGTNAAAPSAGGSAVIVGNQIIYTPLPGFYGEETFTYRMSDSTATDTAQVTVKVKRGDIFANADRYIAYYELEAGTNTAVSFNLPVLANDRIQPALGQVLTITGVGIDDSNQTNAPSQDGEVSVSGDGLSLNYRPVEVAVSNYIERFTYVISDGGIRLAEGDVEVLVVNRTNALVASTTADEFSVSRNSVNNALPVLDNDFILPGNAQGWTITSVSGTAQTGTVSISGTDILYSAPVGFVGVDSFTYQVSDNFGGTGAGLVTVKVGCLSPVDDLFAVISESVNNDLDVVANDSATVDQVNEYTLAGVFGADQGGAIALSASNSVLYTPAAYTGDYPFVETFSYLVDDDSGRVTTGQVSVVVTEKGSDQSTTNVVIVVEGQNDQPVIDNLALNASITDKDTAQPFAGVTITEVDEQLMEVIDVTISLDDADKGILRNLGAFDEIAPGVYEVTNVTAAAANLSIRTLIFDPIENRITVPTNETTFFTISVTDNNSPAVIDTNSFIDVTAVNDAPTLEGTRAGLTTFYRTPIRLFSSVTVTEVDDLTLQPLDITITLSNPAHGILTNLTRFARVTNGVYGATGITAANATAELRAMQFFVGTNVVVKGTNQVTQFDIEVDDRFAAPILDGVTTVTAYSGIGTTLQPTNIALRGSFGLAVDILAEYAVVGAPTATVTGNLAGAAFVYRRLPGEEPLWEELLRLAPSMVETNDRFGQSVSISGDLIAVGAINDETNGVEVGSVYIFEQNAGGADMWNQIARICPTNLTTASDFGFSIALEGDRLAVGAPAASTMGANQGAVFVFERNQGGPDAWGQVAMQVASDVGSTNSTFGFSVALAGDWLAVGAPRNNSDPSDAVEEGATYILSRNQGGADQWGFTHTLPAEQMIGDSEFGWSVGLFQNMLAVGAPGTQLGAELEAGQVSLYTYVASSNVWQLTAQIAEQADSSERFGFSLDFNDDFMMIGAPQNTGVEENLGAVYLYQPVSTGTSTVFNLLQKYTRPVGSQAGLFGGDVALHVDAAIVGAYVNLDQNNLQGSAYMYQFRFNNAPVLAQPIDDQFTMLGDSFAFTIPATTFEDPDAGDSLTIQAAFPGGPNGLAFVNQTVTGTTVNIGFTPVDLTATDESGAFATNGFNVVVLDGVLLTGTPRNLWDLENFGNAVTNPALETTVWGGSANPEGDGPNNDEEYVFGGDPNAPDSGGITLSQDALGNVIVTFLRRTNDPQLTYRLQQAATPFGPWDNRPFGSLTESSMTISDEFEQVTLTVFIDVLDPHKYFRVLATR